MIYLFTTSQYVGQESEFVTHYYYDKNNDTYVYVEGLSRNHIESIELYYCYVNNSNASHSNRAKFTVPNNLVYVSDIKIDIGFCESIMLDRIINTL